MNQLQAVNEQIGRILNTLPAVSLKDVTALIKLVKIQEELTKVCPRFCAAEERFKIDSEKLHAVDLRQRSVMFLRDNDLKRRGA